jgi:hypothetical protein
MNDNLSGAKQQRFNGSFLLLLLLLGGTLAVLCRQGFGPYQVFWNNDLPLGAVVESSGRLPAAFFSGWQDFYWIGSVNPVRPTLTNFSLALLSPAYQYKFYPPASMFFLGFGAWFFFRQLRFSRMACVIGGLGAGLNMHFFSNACWGLGVWDMCCGMFFIALGILVSPSIEKLWIKGVLAGLSVGMAVMEGNDVGAIMSLYVAAFVVFLFLSAESNPAQGAGKVVYVGGVLVVSAFLISLSTIHDLVGTLGIPVTGTAAASQSEAEKRFAWDNNTQWSIPKLETLRMIIPGLFGYRLDMYTTSTNPATYYWGRVAEDPHIGEMESSDPMVRSNAALTVPIPLSPQDRYQIVNIMASHDKTAQDNIVDQIKRMGMQLRHTGNGEYTGVLVCLLALFGLANAARKEDSPYSTGERRMVWFWGGVALFSLMAAWGRYSFVYALLYQLPLLANFRNPQKYMHPMNISVIILSGYGLEALGRQYLAAAEKAQTFFQTMATAWKRVSAFDKWWMAGCVVALGAAVAGYFEFASSKAALITHLEHNGFDPTQSPQIASFSVGEVGWFLFYLALSMGVVVCILMGAFSGRAVWAWALLAAIMICDLSRSDIPWIRYYNYKEKIGVLNPATELLQHDPWEYRVNSRITPDGGYMTSQLGGLCHWWLENDYPFHDIESLEIDQAPHMPVLDRNFLSLTGGLSQQDLSPMTRLWRLTNTRYLLAGQEWEAGLNQFGQPKNSFRTIMRFNLVNKPGIVQPEDPGDQTLQPNTNGSVALIEFTAALPRAKLYANWQVVDDPTALRLLGSAPFDPAKTVLLATNTPVAQAPGSLDADPGTVKITHYKSTDLIMEAEAKTPAVLLLNNRTGDDWHVTVDGQPAPFLRCNYIMQGTFVPAGHHTVEFRYQPPLKLLFISLTAFGVGLLLAGFVIVTHCKREPETPPAAEAKRPGKS